MKQVPSRRQRCAIYTRKSTEHNLDLSLTYTQWEAWLAIGFDKDLLIVAPAPGIERGPSYAPSDASRSQAEHLQCLKAIDRYPIKFTSADNLVAVILESAVIEALVKAEAAPLLPKVIISGMMVGAAAFVLALLWTPPPETAIRAVSERTEIDWGFPNRTDI